MKFLALIVVAFAVAYLILQFVNSGKAKDNIRSGKDFLNQNATIDGVTTTSTGLQYLRLEPGTGDTHPGPRDRVKVHYHGTLIDGTVFDSSVERGEPIDFALNQVIPGWTEGVGMMVEGEKARLFIPSKLAYGNRSAGAIAPGSTLIFDVELIAIHPE